jgi:hypothetical protein
LCINAGRRKHNTNQEEHAQRVNRGSRHDYCITRQGSAVKAPTALR